jgi:hypothetical protein
MKGRAPYLVVVERKLTTTTSTTKLGRSVAIKLLPEAFTHDVERAARLEREARVLRIYGEPKTRA